MMACWLRRSKYTLNAQLHQLLWVFALWKLRSHEDNSVCAENDGPISFLHDSGTVNVTFWLFVQ